LRGSGRFIRSRRSSRARARCFNPLHCGAVVASVLLRADLNLPSLVSIPFIAGQWSLRKPVGVAAADVAVFQSPSLRGSGRFSAIAYLLATLPDLVSIPFIAGQWSLQGTSSTRRHSNPCFNPLHCGAVVAS